MADGLVTLVPAASSDRTLPAIIDVVTTAIVLAVEAEAAVHGFTLAEKSTPTRRAYPWNFAVFSAWFADRGFEPLPAAPAAIAAFLADQAATGVRSSTLARRVAAIAYAHDLAGIPSPTDAKMVRVVLGGIRRQAAELFRPQPDDHVRGDQRRAIRGAMPLL